MAICVKIKEMYKDVCLRQIKFVPLQIEMDRQNCMTEREIMEFQDKIDRGLRLAEERMLREKALHDECVVVQTMDGVIRRIPAKQVLSSLVM